MNPTTTLPGKILVTLLCLSADGAAWSQSTSATAPNVGDTEPARVEVNGRRNETEQRRLSTAAKIVVGREEIEQFGDLTLADVVKRLPSVTVAGRPGRGGQIRMRGMGNGYTQILIDGERMPRGYSIDQISPDMVERIEIYRAPTAETGARAIAGTINIVLREPLRQRGDDLRLGVSDERGHLQPNLSWTRNDVLGELGTYNLTLSASHADQGTGTATDTTYLALKTGHLDLAQTLRQSQHGLKDSLHFSSRVQWQLGDGDQISIQPFLSVSQGHSTTLGTLTQSAGDAVPPYASSVTIATSHSSMARVLLQFKENLGPATRLELRGSLGTFHSNASSQMDETSDAELNVLAQSSATNINDRSWSVNGKLSRTLADKHSLVVGVEAEGVDRDETALTLINGAPSPPGLGGNVSASTRRLATYTQDEWDPSANWSAYAGLRWEGIQTRSEYTGASVSNNSSVLTPLLHAVWRFDAPARDQVRFSLTRSYRPPTLQNIIAVPSLSTLFPAPGPNTASSADKAGNPALLPELATGLDVALEHYLGGSGVVSLSVFRRNIHELIRNVTAQETVPWATSPRWVSRPQNIGDALTQGIELDAKFRADELVDGAWPITVRSNLSLYGSSVSGVPGPYNRVDQQPRASANLGGDYRMKGLPLMFGGNFSWIPPYTVQQTSLQSQAIDLTRVIDTYVLWTINPKAKLRFSLGNVVPRNYITTSSIVAGGQTQTVVANGPTYCVAGIRLELKL